MTWMVISAEYRSNDLLNALNQGWEPFAVGTHSGFEDVIYLRKSYVDNVEKETKSDG